MRLQFRGTLSAMGASARKRKSLKILSVLVKTKIFRDAKTILTYIALPEEVQTQELIKKALRMGKNVGAPKMRRANANFEIFQITDSAQGLKQGKYGVFEPMGRKRINIQTLDLMIIPGLAFDKKGNRLGRGKGYFDRFLEKAENIPSIGLAFKEQLAKSIPVERHDRAVDRVIAA